MRPVELKSPVVKAMQYSRDEQSLTVWYTAGGIYRYFGVSEYLYRLIRLNEERPWPVLWRLVRRHPFQRLTTRAAAQLERVNAAYTVPAD